MSWRTCTRLAVSSLLTLVLGMAGAVQSQAVASDHHPTFVEAPDGTLHALCSSAEEGTDHLDCEACAAMAAVPAARNAGSVLPATPSALNGLPIRADAIHARADVRLPQGRGPPHRF